MDEDQLYVVPPPQSPPRRVPDTVSGEWLAEKLELLPSRKEMYRVALLATATGARLVQCLAAVSGLAPGAAIASSLALVFIIARE